MHLRYAYARTCTYISTRMDKHTHAHAHIHTNMQTYTHNTSRINNSMDKQKIARMCVRMIEYANANIHVCMHTPTYMRISTPVYIAYICNTHA